MKLAIGTAQFGEDYGISNNRKGIPNNEIKEIFNICNREKITIFDTALLYKNSINKIKKNIKKKNKFEIIYKVLIKDKSYKKNFYKNVLFGINKLKGQRISILVHDSDKFLFVDKIKQKRIINFLENLKIKKKIYRYGFSVYNLKEAINIMTNYNFDILQVPINIFNHEFINQKFIKLIKSKKIEIHVRSIFLQGIVFLNKITIKKKLKVIPSKMNRFLLDFESDKEKIFQCLNFIKQLKFVDKIIIGVSSKNELLQILKIYNMKLKKITLIKKYKISEKKYINPSMWPKK
jgi:aryl-alcohol dehydrogenase-like predicted oxidoreductase